MIFLIKNDLNYIVLKRKSWIILYLITMVSFPIFCKLSRYPTDDLFLINIGLKFDSSSFIFVIIYLFNFTFYLFICLDIILRNLKVGVDNVFLRLNKLKVSIAKLVSCFIFIVGIIGLLFFIFAWEYRFLRLDIDNIIVNYIIAVFSKGAVTMLTILLIASYLYKTSLFAFVLFLVSLTLNNEYLCYLQPYLFSSKIILLILSFGIILISYILILKKTIIKLFERSF